MAKKLIVFILFLFSINCFSQRYKDYEIGPMFNYEHTTLIVANGILNDKEEDGSYFSGFEPSYAAGIYAIYYFKPKLGVGAELYFQRTSASELEEDQRYNSLTFMPYINVDPFRRIRNLHFGAGIGAAFIQELPEYGSAVKEEDVRVITIPVKLSASYRLRNQVTFELGAKSELLEVVDENVRRMSLFFGLKIPLNRLNRYYYR